MDSAHHFRLLYKRYMTGKGAQKPTNGVIWIAKSYPPWQACVLTMLQEFYEVRIQIYFKRVRLDDFLLKMLSILF